MHDISVLDRRSQVARVISNETGIDQTMIERLVRTFYTRIREAARLGPVFAAQHGLALAKGHRLPPR